MEYLIEHLLRLGVTGISGRPKVGKSWLAEEMALALSSGGQVLGFQAREVVVLYLALEDSPARLQNRFVQMGAVDGDPVDDIFGSTAKASVLDCAIGLYRKHSSTGAVLKLVGRDSADAEYALTWDPDHFTWQRKEDAKTPTKAARTTSINDRLHVDEILEALDALGPCTLARLATIVKIDKSNLLDLLIAMVEGGLIHRTTGAGRAALLDDSPAIAATTMPAVNTTRTTATMRTTPMTVSPPQPPAWVRTRSSPPTRPKHKRKKR